MTIQAYTHVVNQNWNNYKMEGCVQDSNWKNYLEMIWQNIWKPKLKKSFQKMIFTLIVVVVVSCAIIKKSQISNAIQLLQLMKALRLRPFSFFLLSGVPSYSDVIKNFYLLFTLLSTNEITALNFDWSVVLDGRSVKVLNFHCTGVRRCSGKPK